MLASLLIIVLSVLGFGKPTYAHFIVDDASTGVKAVFHSTPDHDPIAGRETVISYDFSNTGFSTGDYAFSLAVKSTREQSLNVPVEIVSNFVMAEYVFPKRGFYDITLTATHRVDGTVSKLNYGQRVSRGVAAERGVSFSGVEVTMIVGAIVIAVGVTTYSLVSGRNNRKRKKK